MSKILSYLKARLVEPSTGIAIAGIFGLLLPKYAPMVPDLVNGLGAFLGMILGIIGAETKVEVKPAE